MPTLYYRNVVERASLSCASTASTAWHVGRSGGAPFWVFASNCGVPSTPTPTNYAGYNARWAFTVRKAGVYRLDAWVPDARNACDFVSGQFSPAVHYVLGGPTASRSDVSPRASIGAALTLWSEIRLSPGSYVLYLYDDAAGGCQCNATGCSVSERVFADGVGVQFLRE